MNKKNFFLTMVTALFSVCLVAAASNSKTNQSEKEINQPKAKKVKVINQPKQENLPDVVKTIEEDIVKQEIEEPDPTYQDMYTTCSLNIRTHVGVDAERYDTVPQNTKLSVQENFRVDDWVRIIYDNQELYVNGKYLSDTETPVIEEPEPVVDKATAQPVKSYNEDDFYIMSHVIMAEAGGCSWEHMIGVGSVVLNRVNHEAFPNTIKEVVYQKGQYACMWDGNYEKTPNEQSEQAARYLLENGSQMPSNVVWQAEFVQGNGIYKQIGNTYFCYK